MARGDQMPWPEEGHLASSNVRPRSKVCSVDFFQHGWTHQDWDDCLLPFIHYAICQREFIFESKVRSYQGIHTCLGSWPASHYEKGQLLQAVQFAPASFPG